jgi:arsenate reductase (glutaredoxin)
MEKLDALAALAALAQESRLDVFRLLVQAGAEGIPAGQIGERLGLPSATLSFHLNHLKQSGLIKCRRESRLLIYTAEYTVMNGLLAYLTENCCQGNPAACGIPTCNPVPVSEGATSHEAPARMSVTIYHNPTCGTSRNVLGLIRNAGEEPCIIEYLKTPPSRGELAGLIERMGISVRDVLRRKGTPYDELKLDEPALTDDQLLDAMMAHPILINRPIVVSPLGVKLCRPSEVVLDLLPHPQRGAFTKEDGEAVIDARGNRVTARSAE